MTHTLVIADISITVTRKRIKHVHLRVHPPLGEVTISAPMSARLQVVEAFAESRLEWIRRHQERVRGQERKAPHRFIDGESHALWGRQHILSVVERDGRQDVIPEDCRITLIVRPGTDTAGRAAIMHAWHKTILHETLPAMIRTWDQRLKVRLTGYLLRRMKSRWGSCNPRTGHIRLNTELVTKPSYLLEYVLVHEMVHLIVPNHGTRFVNLMNAHYPTWREARAELNATAEHARR